MPRFTIRDVLLVMVIVGLAVGWWVDRWQLESSCREAWRHTADSEMRARMATIHYLDLMDKTQTGRPATPNR